MMTLSHIPIAQGVLRSLIVPIVTVVFGLSFVASRKVAKKQGLLQKEELEEKKQAKRHSISVRRLASFSGSFPTPSAICSKRSSNTMVAQ